MLLVVTPRLHQCLSSVCPLLQAVNSVDFISTLLFGFTSGSIGFSLAGPAAGLVIGPVAAAAAGWLQKLLLVLFLVLLLWSCRSLSSSYLVSQCLVDCFIPSIQSFCSMWCVPEAFFDSHLQRSECACALLLSLMALQPWYPIVAPDSSMSFLVFLSHGIRAPSKGNGGIGMGSTRTSGL